MAIEAKIIDEVIKKIEKNIENKVVEDYEKILEDNGEVENSCNESAIKPQIKKSNEFAKILITWVPMKKKIPIVAITLIILCLYLTVKPMNTSTNSFYFQDYSINKELTSFYSSSISTLISLLKTNFNLVNGGFKEKYDYLKDWLINKDGKINKASSISIQSNFLTSHEDIEDTKHKSKQSKIGKQGWPNIELNFKELEKIDYPKDENKMNKEDSDSIVGDLLHSNNEDCNIFDHRVEYSKKFIDPKFVEVSKVVENVENDPKKENKLLEEETKFENKPYKIKDLHDIDIKVNKNMYMKDDNFVDYKYIDAIRISNYRNEKLNEEIEINSTKEISEKCQDIVNHRKNHSNLDNDNNSRTYLEEEMQLDTNHYIHKDLNETNIKDFSYFNDSIKIIDNTTKLENTNVYYLHNTLPIIQGYEIEAEYIDDSKEKSSLDDHDLCDNLLSVKDHVNHALNLIILEESHDMSNPSINFIPYSYDSIENEKIDHENETNIGLSSGNGVNIKVNEEAKKIVNLLPNDKNVDGLDTQLDQVNQIKPLEYFEGGKTILEHTNLYNEISSELKETNNELKIPNEMVYKYMNLEPLGTSIEIENKTKSSKNIFKTESNMEHSLHKVLNDTMQNVDNTNKNIYSFLNSNNINEADKMDKQSMENHIDIKMYESENDKKDGVARKEDIKQF